MFMVMKISVVVLFGDPSSSKGPFAGYDPCSLQHAPTFKVELWSLTEPSALKSESVQSASAVTSKDRYLQTVSDHLRTPAGFCRASFCFRWLRRAHQVGFSSRLVSNVVSKPEIVMQVPSVSPFTTARSYTEHISPVIYDEGETWSNCNQRGNKGDGMSNDMSGGTMCWHSHKGRSLSGTDPISWIPVLVEHEKITTRWYSDYNHPCWQYFALWHTHLMPGF